MIVVIYTVTLSYYIKCRTSRYYTKCRTDSKVMNFSGNEMNDSSDLTDHDLPGSNEEQDEDNFGDDELKFTSRSLLNCGLHLTKFVLHIDGVQTSESLAWYNGIRNRPQLFLKVCLSRARVRIAESRPLSSVRSTMAW